MNKNQFQELFQQKYNRENWHKLFGATSANFEQLANPADFQTSNKNIETLKQLGTITLNDDKKNCRF